MKIEIEKLIFGYRLDETLFEVADLSLAAGETVGIVGPSGAGKTTFLRLLAGICLPVSGAIRLDGEVISRLGDGSRRRFRNQKIGLVFQDFRLVEYLSIEDNVKLPFLVGTEHSPRESVQSRMHALIDRLELAGRVGALPGQLSQGEQQRVAIGRALMTSPRLILADEPTGNLDERNKVRMRDLLVDYSREHGVTMLMVTHDPQLLEPFDRVIDFSDFQKRKGQE